MEETTQQTAAFPVQQPPADGCVAIFKTNLEDVVLGVMSAKYNAQEAVTDFVFSSDAGDLAFIKFELIMENEEPAILTNVEAMARAIVSMKENPSEYDIKFSYYCGEKHVTGSLEMAEKFVKDLIAYSKHVVQNLIEEAIQIKFCDRSLWPAMVATVSLGIAHGLKCNGTGVWETYTQGIEGYPGYKEGMELCALVTPSCTFNLDFVVAGVRGQFLDVSQDEADTLIARFKEIDHAEFYARHKLSLAEWHGNICSELNFDFEPDTLIIG